MDAAQHYDFECVLTSDDFRKAQKRLGHRPVNLSRSWRIAFLAGLLPGLLLLLSDLVRTNLAKPIQYEILALSLFSFVAWYSLLASRVMSTERPSDELRVKYSFRQEFFQTTSFHGITRTSWHQFQSLDCDKDFWRLLRGDKASVDDALFPVGVIPADIQTELAERIIGWVRNSTKMSKAQLIAGVMDEAPQFCFEQRRDEELMRKCLREVPERIVDRQSESLGQGTEGQPKPISNQNASAANGKGSMAVVWGGVFLALVPMFFPAPYREFGVATSSGVIVAALSYFVFLMAMSFACGNEIRRQLSAPSLASNVMFTVEISNAGFLSSLDGDALTFLPWGAIREVKESESSIRFSGLDNQDHIVFKASFRNQDEVNELLEFACVNLGRNLLAEAFSSVAADSGNPYQAPHV